LFGIENGELRAVMHDGYVNQMVIGATGALGVKYLSPDDAHSVGIIGSGWQAQGQLKAVATVRDITDVKVFSLTEANREAFARTMSGKIGAKVIPVSSYEEAVRGSDIVITATSSYDPFLHGDWLEPGQHIDAMGGGDRTNKMREMVRRCL
jgi:ornithine cyclodeaminase/alanine dehydrogenase-like protein (mu-crystallin family)